LEAEKITRYRNFTDVVLLTSNTLAAKKKEKRGNGKTF
jgi:hypothetical protein